MEAGSNRGEQGIRSALLNRHLRHHQTQDGTLIVDELGLAHARGRIDVAVINGRVHGYEIKSAEDTLDRLPRQLDVYRKSLQTLTLVVATRHLTTVEAAVPEWCGILEAVQGPRGGVNFRRCRRAQQNPEVDPFMLAHLLWLDEARAALAENGLTGRDLKGSRKDLYRLLLEVVSVPELIILIKQSMMRRENWRVALPQM